jgi:hypothetical protein
MDTDKIRRALDGSRRHVRKYVGHIHVGIECPLCAIDEALAEVAKDATEQSLIRRGVRELLSQVTVPDPLAAWLRIHTERAVCVYYNGKRFIATAATPVAGVGETPASAILDAIQRGA